MTELVDNDVRDFTVAMDPHRFKIGEDVFTAPAILAPVKAAKLGALAKNLNLSFDTPEQAVASMQTVADLFRELIGGGDGQLFARHIMSDGEPDEDGVVLRPFDIQREAMPALMWLMERYGLRPTQQSSVSLPESTTGDLTDGVSVEESIGDESEASSISSI